MASDTEDVRRSRVDLDVDTLFDAELESEGGEEEERVEQEESACSDNSSEDDSKHYVGKPAETLLLSLINDLRRARTSNHLATYIPFMGLVCLQLFLTTVDLKSSPAYHLVQASQLLLDWEDFQKMEPGESANGFFPTLKKTAEKMWDNSTVGLEQENALGFILVRQWRTRWCGNLSDGELLAVPRAIRVGFERSKCLLRDTEKESVITSEGFCGMGGELFGERCVYVNGSASENYSTQLLNNPPWYGNDQPRTLSSASPLARDVDSVKLLGKLHDLELANKAYTVYLPFSRSLQEIQEEITALKEVGWLDLQTRAVSVECLMFNKVEGLYLHTVMLWEVDPAGSTETSFHSRFYSPFSVARPLSLVMDVLICIYLLWEASTSAIAEFRYAKLREGGNNIPATIWALFSVWNLMHIMGLAYFIITYVYRFQLWARGTELEGGSFYDKGELDPYVGSWGPSGKNLTDTDQVSRHMWVELVQLADMNYMMNRAYAMAVLVSFLRVFGLLRYNERLSIVTNTISAASWDIGGLGISLAVIVAGWAVAGVYLYGSSVQGFETLSASVQTLLFEMTSGEVEAFEETEQSAPTIAPMYHATYIAVTMFVILNMMIAMITGHFQMVQAMVQKGTSWRPAVILRDIQMWFTKAMGMLLVFILFPTAREDDDRSKGPDDETIQIEAISILRKVGSGQPPNIRRLAKMFQLSETVYVPRPRFVTDEGPPPFKDSGAAGPREESQLLKNPSISFTSLQDEPNKVSWEAPSKSLMTGLRDRVKNQEKKREAVFELKEAHGRHTLHLYYLQGVPRGGWTVDSIRYEEVSGRDGATPLPHYYPAFLAVTLRDDAQSPRQKKSTSVLPGPALNRFKSGFSMSRAPTGDETPQLPPPTESEKRVFLPPKGRGDILTKLKRLARLAMVEYRIPHSIPKCGKPVNLQRHELTKHDFWVLLRETLRKLKKDDGYDEVDTRREEELKQRSEGMFQLANKELGGEEVNYKVKDELQREIRRKVNKIEKAQPYQKALSEKFEVARNLLEEANEMTEPQEVPALVEDTKEFERVMDVIKLGVSKAGEVERMIEDIIGRTKQVREVKENAHRLQARHGDYCHMVRAATHQMQTRTKAICNKVNRDVQGGLPTSALSEQRPILMSGLRGKGRIEKVETHGFRRSADDPGENLLGPQVTEVPFAMNTSPASDAAYLRVLNGASLRKRLNIVSTVAAAVCSAQCICVVATESIEILL
eukprot:Hpha_TRINITY_DN16459_c5_g1::TRINITY_DN16459_c5_g1_i1::g.162935::m.162935/K04986/PKD2; polycystin 2